MPATAYVLEGPTWQDADHIVTWNFGQSGFSSDVGDAYKTVFEQAFARWSSVANVTFQQVATDASADISVGWGQFSGTELGETNYYHYTDPNTNRDAFVPCATVRAEDPDSDHVNPDTNSTYANFDSTLYQVVLHEIGHAIGLGHDNDPNSVMYAYSSASDRNLNQTDIDGVQALYGKPLPPTPAAPTLVQGRGNPGTSTSPTPTLHGTAEAGTTVTIIEQYVAGGPADLVPDANFSSGPNGSNPLGGWVAHYAGGDTSTVGTSGPNTEGRWDNATLPGDPAQVLFLDASTGTASASLTLKNLVVGRSYVVDYRAEAADMQPRSGPVQIDLLVDGNSITSSIEYGDDGGMFSHRTVTFTATATQQVVAFSATNAYGDKSTVGLIGDVSIIPASDVRGTATVAQDGTWSFQLPQTIDGPHNYSVTETNGAGTTSHR